MKKLFSFIAAALVTLGANAQKSWNFSDWEVQTFTETTTIEDLTIVATSSNKVEIDENTKTVDDVRYTKRLKFGGTGDATYRHVKFDVDGPCEIAVVLSHSSSSGDARNLNICAEAFSTTSYLTQFNVAAGEIKKNTYTYAGEATTICIGSASSGINLYAIYVTPIDESTPQVEFPEFKIGSYNYEKEGYAVTVTSATEGATVSYKVGNDSYTDVENGSTIYVKDGKLTIKATKDDYRDSEEKVVATLNAAPSSTSPETLIAFRTDSDDSDRDQDHNYVSVSLSGSTYVAGIDSNGNGLKLRSNKKGSSITSLLGEDNSDFCLKVNEGYKVMAVKITATSNTNGASINVPNMYIDGEKVEEFDAFDIPAKDATAITKEFTNLNATSEIAWEFAKSSATQWRATIEVTYVPTTETKEVTTHGWATYIPAYAAQFEADAAYIVTGVDTENGVVTVENVTAVPANTPVLLKGAGNKTITFIENATDPSNNKLSIVDAETDADNGKVPYVLAKDGDNAGFKYWTGELSQIDGRVVLWLDSAQTARSFFGFGEDGTTGIQHIEVSTENNTYYDLQGRRVLPTKGLYILNGKKVIIK